MARQVPRTDAVARYYNLGWRALPTRDQKHGPMPCDRDNMTDSLATESFAQLFEQSLANQRIRPGMILTGLVVNVTDDVVIVNVGLKSEAVIDINQFKNERGEVEVK